MYDLLQGLLYSMALRSILYTAAIIIVLFHDCQADAYVPKSQVTWWGYLKSWLKHAAVVHFFLSLLSDTFHSVGRLARWLFPRKPPDLEARRRRRLAEALQMHWSRAPRSNTCSRLLAAATIAVRFSASGVRGSQIAVAPSPLSVVLQSLEPAPPFNPASEYLHAMSLVLDSTELDDPSPICMWDSDTRVCVAWTTAPLAVLMMIRETLFPARFVPVIARSRLSLGYSRARFGLVLCAGTLWITKASYTPFLSPTRTLFQREV